MFTHIYIEEKLREHRRQATFARDPRPHGSPDAEVNRTGVGRVHEVFRRIAEGERPARAPRRKWIFAG